MENRLLDFILTPAGFMTAGLSLTFLFLIIVLAVAQKRGKLDWRDLITRTGSNKVSLSKLLQLVGGITATWVIVKTTVTQSGLSWELFTAYLAYVGSVEAYSKFVAARYNLPNSDNQSSAARYESGSMTLSEETYTEIEEDQKPKKGRNQSGGAKAM